MAAKEEIGLVRGARGDLASVFHDAGEHHIVVMCHGFRGTKAGPHRFFVRLARTLAERGVSTLRFDQWGSGDSAGDFEESSFDDWVLSIGTIVQNFLKRGSRVSLLGQSMGGAAAIVAASRIGSALTSLVAWAPDPVLEKVDARGEFMEEDGERVLWRFWLEAQKADVVKCFSKINIPALTLLCEQDECVSDRGRRALLDQAGEQRQVRVYPGFGHSSWSHAQATKVISETAAFFAK
jgi:uncharacterized protein